MAEDEGEILIPVKEEIEGDRDSTGDFVFVRVGASVPLKPSKSAFDLRNPPCQPIAISQRHRLLFLAHSQGFFVARTDDIIEISKEIKEKGKGPSVEEVSLVDVKIGRVSTLAISKDESTLAAAVDQHIFFFSVLSLLDKEQEPSFSCSLNDPDIVKDFKWQKNMEKSFVVLSRHGTLYHGILEAELKKVMDNVDAVDWSAEQGFVAVARKHIITILSSNNFKEILSLSLFFESWPPTDSEYTVKVDSIKWLRDDSIIIGCLQENEDADEEGYLVQVIKSKRSNFSEVSCNPVVYSFPDLFDGIWDILPIGCGPYLLANYLDNWNVVLTSNQKAIDQHISLLKLSMKDNRREVVSLEFCSDKYTPKIEVPESGDDNLLLGFCVEKYSSNEKIKIRVDEKFEELVPRYTLLCLTSEGKLNLFHAARISECTDLPQTPLLLDDNDIVKERYFTSSSSESSTSKARLKSDLGDATSEHRLKHISTEAVNSHKVHENEDTLKVQRETISSQRKQVGDGSQVGQMREGFAPLSLSPVEEGFARNLVDNFYRNLRMALDIIIQGARTSPQTIRSLLSHMISAVEDMGGPIYANPLRGQLDEICGDIDEWRRLHDSDDSSLLTEEVARFRAEAQANRDVVNNRINAMTHSVERIKKEEQDIGDQITDSNLCLGMFSNDVEVAKVNLQKAQEAMKQASQRLKEAEDKHKELEVMKGILTYKITKESKELEKIKSFADEVDDPTDEELYAKALITIRKKKDDRISALQMKFRALPPPISFGKSSLGAKVAGVTNQTVSVSTSTSTANNQSLPSSSLISTQSQNSVIRMNATLAPNSLPAKTFGVSSFDAKSGVLNQPALVSTSTSAPSIPSSSSPSSLFSQSEKSSSTTFTSLSTESRSSTITEPTPPVTSATVGSVHLDKVDSNSQPARTLSTASGEVESVLKNEINLLQTSSGTKKDAASLSHPEIPSSTALLSTATENDGHLDVSLSQEDEMEEEAPDTTTTLSLGSFGGFGLGSTPSSSAPKPNPFGGPFLTANSGIASPTLTLTAPAGESFRPASFSLPSAQQAQTSQPASSGGFSSGLDGGFSGFGQPAQVGVGQQALGSVLGTFRQSRQLGSGMPGIGFPSSSAFSGGLSPSANTGGFATAGGFSSAAAGGGFASFASAGGGFAAAAKGGGFSSLASGGGFAGAAAGGGFGVVAPSSGFPSTAGGGFGGAATGASFASGGFAAFGSNQGGGFSAFGGNTGAGSGKPPAELLTQMRK